MEGCKLKGWTVYDRGGGGSGQKIVDNLLLEKGSKGGVVEQKGEKWISLPPHDDLIVDP